MQSDSNGRGREGRTIQVDQGGQGWQRQLAEEQEEVEEEQTDKKTENHSQRFGK